jgi:acyl carrier protein
MTRVELKAAVLEALSTVVPEANPAEINPGVPIRDQLDLDSMDFNNFVVALDEALKVDVPEADYGRLTTLDACVDYLAGRLGIAAGAP